MGRQCVGFIHSPVRNSWQPLASSIDPAKSISVGEDTNTMYLKQAKASLPGCSNQTEWIDSSQFTNYVRGAEFKTNMVGQCKPADVSDLKAQADNMKKQNEKYLKKGKRDIDEYNQLNTSTNNTYRYLAHQYRKGEQQIKEYRDAENSMKHLVTNPTTDKSVEDSQVMDEYYHSHTIIWAMGTIMVLFAVAAAKKL